KLEVVRRGDEVVPGRGLDAEPEASREAQGTQHAEAVLREAGRGIADRPQHSAAQVLHSRMRVTDLATQWMPGDGIDREVAPLEIGRDIACKGDPGTTAIGLHVTTKGGHFIEMPIPAEN